MPDAPRSLFTAYSSAFPAVFIDQYGVLHDGRRPYPGAIDALAALKARGARVVILSNSGRSGEANGRRMAAIGFDPDLYDHFVTSGDAAKSALVHGETSIDLRAATRCLTISTSGAHDLADELGLISSDDAAEADLLVISGSRTDRISLDDYERLIAPAAARLSCICTNPDKLMLTGNGLRPGAGAIASLYENRKAAEGRADNLNPAYGYKGSAVNKPKTIFDDGVKTYFKFSGDAPAIFEVLPGGDETLINYHREGEIVVVDKVAAQWTLRAGDQATCVFNLSAARTPAPAKDVTPVNDPLADSAAAATPRVREVVHVRY